ncbi:hypothetical protein BJY00DRAFT_310577 [Aspergillus carlsbadensis]|nr:hypothetical protein BJY00DRAFT_310577 [Aspergillus carlsbadensis]
MDASQVYADVHLGLTTGLYPGVELDREGAVTMIVTIPANVAQHFRISVPPPSQTLEHDLAHNQGQPQVMLPARVSGPLLAAASNHFREVLATRGVGNIAETEAHWTGNHEIFEMRNRDGLGSLIMLIAVHDRRDLLPQYVPQNILARAVNMAHAHECAQAVTPLCSLWVDEWLSRNVLPLGIHRDLEVWVMVGWVLRHQACFGRATGTWIVSAIDTAVAFHPRMPQVIYTRINMRREAHLTYYISRLHTFRDRLATEGCIAANETDTDRKAECAESVFSSLTIHMDQAGLLSPLPVAPFRGISLRGLWEFIQSKNSPAIAGHPHCQLGPRLVSLFQDARIFLLDVNDVRAEE